MVQKKIALLVAIAILLAPTLSVYAEPNLAPVVNNKSGKNILIPAHAVEVAPNVFSLGESLDKEKGDMVEGYAIVHRKKGNAKPDHAGGRRGGNNNTDSSSCYGFFGKGVKWKVSEDWVVNPSNPYGISDNSVFSILNNGITKWEDAADGVVDGNVSVDILGFGSITSNTLVADTSAMDNINEVYFDLLDEGTIGVTFVWGVFGGSPSKREIREWDQVYNTFYEWSDTGEALKMDFDNIATHELGHSVGLIDFYESSCSEETMYGYGEEGEIKKRDLNAGDIEGINKLY